MRSTKRAKKTEHLFKPPYRAVWSGEFEEMQDAETRLMWIIPASLGLIFVLLVFGLAILVGCRRRLEQRALRWRWAAFGPCA